MTYNVERFLRSRAVGSRSYEEPIRELTKQGSLVPLPRAGLLEPAGQISNWNEFKKNKGRKMAMSM